MKTEKLLIQESDISLTKARDLITKLIDDYIRNRRLQQFAEWERTHMNGLNELDDNLRMLISKKNQINQLLAETESEDILVDLNVSLDVTVKVPQMAKA
ncbi:MAG: hypothetical protein EP333_06260 [Bacteroidetes bacterium]|nr:MAG: hypothetical protein EP333_06260 [Bacteroidota bacterium]